MDAGGEQRFVGVYVANPGDEGLAEQDRLDKAAMPLEAGKEFFKRDGERIRPYFFQQFWQLRIEFEAAELTDVIIDQIALLEVEDGACVLCGVRIPKQLARHA